MQLIASRIVLTQGLLLYKDTHLVQNRSVASQDLTTAFDVSGKFFLLGAYSVGGLLVYSSNQSVGKNPHTLPEAIVRVTNSSANAWVSIPYVRSGRLLVDVSCPVKSEVRGLAACQNPTQLCGMLLPCALASARPPVRATFLLICLTSPVRPLTGHSCGYHLCVCGRLFIPLNGPGQEWLADYRSTAARVSKRCFPQLPVAVWPPQHCTTGRAL